MHGNDDKPGRSSEPISSSESSTRKIFILEFGKEIVSALVPLPILWVFANAFGIKSGGMEFLGAPLLLAWFVARGWKTDSLSWPSRLPLWKFLPRFAIATSTIVVAPALFALGVYGWFLVIKSPSIPVWSLILFTASLVFVGLVVWLNRLFVWNLTLKGVGLSEATPMQKFRFGFYWVVSLCLFALILRPAPPSFADACEAARLGNDLSSEPPTIEDGAEFFTCTVSVMDGEYTAVIGSVSPKDDRGRKSIFHHKVIMDAGGIRGNVLSVDRFYLLKSDPRATALGKEAK